MLLPALVLLLWSPPATPQTLDLSRSGLEAAPADLCSRGLSVANLCGNKLRTPPPCCSSFRGFFLYRNSIQQLPDDWLAECSLLEEVSVSQNHLRRLPPGLLAPAAHLRRLQASRNRLASLPPALLWGATVLRELDLSHNELTEIPHGFLNNTRHLVELFLQGNSLENLPEDLLASCGGLRVLWLSHNRLARLPRALLAGAPHLRALRLDHNQLLDVAGGAFDNSLQLRFLDLSSNRLTSLPPGLFRKATSLRRLLLADNLLSVVPPAGSLPPQRAVIDLTYNLLQTVEDLDAFGASRVLLDHNAWCQQLLPASKLGRLDGAGGGRWFEQRPVRYDRLAGRGSLTPAGLLRDCGAAAADPEHRVSHAGADVYVDDSAPTVSIKHEAVTESPPTSERIVATTRNIASSEDPKIDTTHDTKYNTTTRSGRNTAVMGNFTATTSESNVEGNGITETNATTVSATTVSSDTVATTHPEENSPEYSVFELPNTTNGNKYYEKK